MWLNSNQFSFEDLPCISSKIGLSQVLRVKYKLNLSCSMTKTTKWLVRPAKTKISLGIRPVWTVFAVCMKKHWPLTTYWAQMPTLIWVFTGRICHFVGFVVWRLICEISSQKLFNTKNRDELMGSFLKISKSETLVHINFEEWLNLNLVQALMTEKLKLRV